MNTFCPKKVLLNKLKAADLSLPPTLTKQEEGGRCVLQHDGGSVCAWGSVGAAGATRALQGDGGGGACVLVAVTLPRVSGHRSSRSWMGLNNLMSLIILYSISEMKVL